MAVQFAYGFKMYHHATLNFQFLVKLKLNWPTCTWVRFYLVFVAFVLVNCFMWCIFHFHYLKIWVLQSSLSKTSRRWEVLQCYFLQTFTRWTFDNLIFDCLEIIEKTKLARMEELVLTLRVFDCFVKFDCLFHVVEDTCEYHETTTYYLYIMMIIGHTFNYYYVTEVFL